MERRSSGIYLPTYGCTRKIFIYSFFLSYLSISVFCKFLIEKLKSLEMTSSEKNFRCKSCGKSFTTKGILSTHLKKIHNEKYKSFQCELCSESFFKKNVLVQHRNKSHLGEYECKICFKSFGKLGILNNHIAVIHEEKYHKKCNICNRSVQHLKYHMQKIHQEKYYQCELCSESYLTRKDLAQHRNRSHHGE